MANKIGKKKRDIDNEMNDSDDSRNSDKTKCKMDLGEVYTPNANQYQREIRPKTELYKPMDNKQQFYVNAVCKDKEIDPIDLGMIIQKF